MARTFRKNVIELRNQIIAENSSQEIIKHPERVWESGGNVFADCLRLIWRCIPGAQRRHKRGSVGLPCEIGQARTGTADEGMVNCGDAE